MQTWGPWYLAHTLWKSDGLSTCEARASRSLWVQDQPGLHSEFQDSWGYVERHCLSKTNKQTSKQGRCNLVWPITLELRGKKRWEAHWALVGSCLVENHSHPHINERPCLQGIMWRMVEKGTWCHHLVTTCPWLYACTHTCIYHTQEVHTNAHTTHARTRNFHCSTFLFR